MATPEILNIPTDIFGNFLPIFFVLIGIIANVFPGIPEEVFLITLGYLVSKNDAIYSFLEIYIFSSVGFLLIDTLVYYLSYKGSKITNNVLKKFLKINLEENKIFLEKNMGKIVFFSRFLLQIRALGPILAGVTHYPFKKFITINALALAIYVPSIMWIGYYFSNRIEKVIKGANIASNIAFGVFVLIILIFIAIKMRQKFFSYLKAKNISILKK